MLFTVCLLTSAILTNLADIASAVSSARQGLDFRTVGSVLTVSHGKSALVMLSDGVGSMVFRDTSKGRASLALSPGNVVQAVGKIAVNEYGFPAANCAEFSVLSPGSPPEVIHVTAAQLQSKAHAGKLVRVGGTVREVFRDEIDPKYLCLTLTDEGTTFHASICDDMERNDLLQSLLDARITLTGICSRRRNGLRKLFGWEVSICQIDSIVPPLENPYDAPLIAEEEVSSPADVAQLGKRRTIGRVIAVRSGKDVVILIRDATGSIREIRPRSKDLPRHDDVIEAVGYAETDLYRINLTDAIWRRTPPVGIGSDTTPSKVSAPVMLTDGKGNLKIDPTYHGRLVTLRGTLMDVPSSTSPQSVMTLNSENFTIPVDVSANRNALTRLSVGCEIEVTGTCIVESKNWRPHSALPRTTGITIVPRTEDDLVVLARPPWWTPRKLLIVISSLLLALAGFIVWNRILNRLVVRRSRALLKEQLALAEAELKVGERTRLAIELHDSLSQNLAAVACQIAATESAVAIDRDEAIKNIQATERMLLSCRTELRRCLWDLRNDTLEERNMTEVVRKVLKPVIGNAELRIRFNVPRSRLDDSTVHAIISIVRELVSNAVQHGHAAHVTVAGDLTDGVLAFSVSDSGTGFDPANCNGPGEGHFGLEGIRERVERLRGEFTLESAVSSGTRARIRFRIGLQDAEEENP